MRRRGSVGEFVLLTFGLVACSADVGDSLGGGAAGNEDGGGAEAGAGGVRLEGGAAMGGFGTGGASDGPGGASASGGAGGGGVVGALPIAQITHPEADDGPRQADVPFPFNGVGNDAEDGALTGTSLVWESDLEGPIGTGEMFDAALTVVGLHTVTLTATDSDGNTGIDTVMVPIQVESAPVAQINHPGANDGPRPVDEPFPFVGVATDAEDGSLSGASLVWTSDLQGPIGTGQTFDAALTIVGVHTITLTAADSDANMGWDSVIVPIE
jgi:hypothetical protein